MKTSNWMGSISAQLIRLFDRLGGWLDRSRQRAALGGLDERLLADMACDRATAAAEADKPFWRG